jgi:Cu/Ag efflux protein CusF
MNLETARPWLAAIVLAALPMLSACESDGGTSTSTPAVTEQPATMIAEEYAETEATIEAIDPKTRNVTLLTADGKTMTVEAPPDTDLNRIKKGDVVVFSAYQSISVRALAPGASPLGVTREASMVKAAPGETPGRAVGAQTRAVLEIADIDRTKNTVTLKGADGSLRTLEVRNPDNQRKLKELSKGDLVQIDVFDAIAIGIKPKT